MLFIKSVCIAACVVVMSMMPSVSANQPAEDCRLNFLSSFAVAVDPVVKCNILRLYNQCLVEVFPDSSVEEAQSFYTLLAQSEAVVPDCDASKPPLEDSTLAIQDQVIQFSSEKDVRFQRYRRDSVSIDQLQQDIEDLRDALTGAIKFSDLTVVKDTCKTLVSKGQFQDYLNRNLNQQRQVFDALTDSHIKGSMEKVKKAEAAASSCVSESDAQTSVSGWKSKLNAAKISVTKAINDAASAFQTATPQIANDIDALRTQVDNFVGQANAALDSLHGSTQTQSSTLTGQVNSLIDAVSSQSALDDVLHRRADVLEQDIEEAKMNVDTSITQRKLPMFSGWCNRHGSSGGNYVKYCLNTVEFNTGPEYIGVKDANNGIIQIKKSGFYNINFFTISHASYAYPLLYINGAYRHHGHEYGLGQWMDQSIWMTWPLNAGDELYVQLYLSGGSYNYHAGNWFGAHSRFQITYAGSL